MCVCFKMVGGWSLTVESAAGKHKLCSGFAEIKKRDPVTISYLTKMGCSKLWWGMKAICYFSAHKFSYFLQGNTYFWQKQIKYIRYLRSLSHCPVWERMILNFYRIRLHLKRYGTECLTWRDVSLDLTSLTVCCLFLFLCWWPVRGNRSSLLHFVSTNTNIHSF